MSILLRHATVGDAPGIVQLISEHAESMNEPSPISTGYIAAYLESPVSAILLAIQNEQIVGLLSYSIRPDLYHAAECCLIEELIVTRRSRKQGIGRELLNEVFLIAEARDCAEIALAVMPDNADAIRFYRKHGLTEEAIYLERHLDAKQ